MKFHRWFVGAAGFGAALLAADLLPAQTVTIDTSPAGQQQVIDGFGTCLSGSEGQQSWWQRLESFVSGGGSAGYAIPAGVAAPAQFYRVSSP